MRFLRSLVIWAAILCIGGFVVGKIGIFLYLASTGYAGTGIAVIGAVVFVGAANFLLYSFPYLFVDLFGRLFPSIKYSGFAIALSINVLTAFGPPLVINSLTASSVFLARSGDMLNSLPADQDVHSVAFDDSFFGANDEFCTPACVRLLLSRRFDHVTFLGTDHKGIESTDKGPEIPPGREYSLENGDECQKSQSAYQRSANGQVAPSPFKREGDCIVSQSVILPADDIVVFHGYKRYGPGEGIGLIDFERTYFGVQKGTRSNQKYDWSRVTKVSYFKVPFVFLIRAGVGWLNFPTIFEQDARASGGDTELDQFIRRLGLLSISR